jgi:hypothetical protein
VDSTHTKEGEFNENSLLLAALWVNPGRSRINQSYPGLALKLESKVKVNPEFNPSFFPP